MATETRGTLFGPSDFQSVNVTNADGTQCHHDFKKNRRVVPSYNDEERSLPTVNCAKCRDHLLREGFATTPDKVRRTADEIEYEDRAEREGALATRLMSKQLGETLGTLLAQDKANKK